MPKISFPAKKKGVRRGEITEEQAGFTASIYGEVYDFCQGITHNRLTPFQLLNQNWRGTWFGIISAVFEVAQGSLGDGWCVN